MDVKEYSLREVLEGKTRYIVPLYQRRYSWTHSNHKQLWDDILDIAQRRAQTPAVTHFTGSLVLSVESSSPGMSAFLVVDGQQRLTTLSVLLLAIRDHWALMGEQDRHTEVHDEYLTNRFAKDGVKAKLVPTQADRDIYFALLDHRPIDDPDSVLDDAHRYFTRQLASLGEDEPTLDAIQDAVLDGLAFVTITTQDSDNVYRIFESLNNTGIPLTQADLVRNLVFMRLGEEGEEAYASTWLPLQDKLSATDLENLFWFDLVWQNPETRLSDTYQEQKRQISKFDRAGVRAFIERMERVARSLRLMRDPNREQDPSVREHLHHFEEWASSTTDPLVLRVLHLREDGSVNSEQAAAALKVLESYLVRRFLIGATAAGLNRTLAQAAAELSDVDDDPAEFLHQFLSSGRKKYATDAEVRQAVLNRPFYETGKGHQRRAVLTWIESLHPSKERAQLEGLTIEHVLPQTLTDDWLADFSASLDEAADVDSEYEALVHTLGNLTFTAYNPELSNRRFSEKRQLLTQSSVPGNYDISRESEWGAPQIRSRGAMLAERIVAHWTGPVPGLEQQSTGADWSLFEQLVSQIPPGHWASYSDVGLAIGAHAISVGQRLANHHVDGAWRVLKWSGRVGKDFRWPVGSPHEGKDPVALLESEGLSFDSKSRADPTRRIRVPRLLALLGLDTDDEGTTSDEGVHPTPSLSQVV